MAKVVKDVALSRSKYPWDEWLNGKSWEVKRGIDFSTAPVNFRAMAYLTAKKRGLKLNVHTKDEVTFIIKASEQSHVPH